MATRRPIVLVSGISSELPVGDNIDGSLYQGQQVVAGSGLAGGGLFSSNPRVDVALAANPSGLYFTGDNKLGFDGQGDNIQVIASGVGAVYRTVQDKGRDIVSVKDFGAIGDGVQDDTSYIQAAIDASAGSVVFIPKGTYVVTSSVSIPSNTVVCGEGSSTVLITSASVNIFSSTGTSLSRRVNIKITDLKLTRTAGSGDFINLTYVDDSLIERVFATGFGSANSYIRLAGTRRCVVRECTGTTMAQLLLASSAGSGNTGDYGEDNIVIASSFSGGSQGVTIQRQTRLRCIGVVSNNNGSVSNPFGVGFDIEAAASNNLIFESCVAADNYEGGFYIEGAVGGSVINVNFIGCIAKNNNSGSVGAGFRLEQNFSAISISNCISTGNKYGVYSYKNSGVRIADNTLESNTTDGIRIFNGYLSSITSNLIKDNGGWGITIAEDGGSTQALTIANNIITGNTSGTVTGFNYTKGTYDAFGQQTYTPTLTGSTGGSVTLANAFGYYSINNGRCVGKIYAANNTATTLTGEWRFSLPATAAAGTANGGVGVVSYTRALPTSANATYYFLGIGAGNNYGTLYWGYNNGTEGAAVTGVPAANVICTIDFDYAVS